MTERLVTCCRDEDGNLVDPLEGEELVKWKKSDKKQYNLHRIL